MRKLSTNEFIIAAQNVHGVNKYDYSQSIYVSSRTIVKIICKKHGEFSQLANNHLRHHGCPECGNDAISIALSSSLNDFIEKSKMVHGNFYDYSKSVYTNNHTPVIITCPKHGDFHQIPDIHSVRGSRCPKCTSHISKPEIKWLDMLGIPNDFRQKSVYADGKKFRVDAYAPDTNTVYEFYGDFWHGNCKIYDQEKINPLNKIKYGELYLAVVIREKQITDAGYNLISIWESDFKNDIKKRAA